MTTCKELTPPPRCAHYPTRGIAERSAYGPKCRDRHFGPFFIKFCTYFPYNARLCLNGNEWAKRQAVKAGIGFQPLDNAFAAVDDVPALQAICDRLGEQQIQALLGKWLARLPYPFTNEDTTAGYRYDISIVQAEFSLTQMLDRPVTGRIFLEQLIRDNLDIGRPDRISLIFGRRIHTGRRRRTPGTFRTRVITNDVRCPQQRRTPPMYRRLRHGIGSCGHKMPGQHRGLANRIALLPQSLPGPHAPP